MLIPYFVALICFIKTSLSFDFKQLTVVPTLPTIGITTQYYILYQRYINNVNSQTSWSSSQVPADSTITLTFPSDYTLSSSIPTCLTLLINNFAAVSYNCTTSGNVLTISGAITNAASIYNVQLTLSNVLNPVPAVTTGSFQGTIGIDASVPNGGATVQLQPANFDSCTVTFDSAFVNQTSTMVITIDPKNGFDSSSYIAITVPRRYTNDIVTTSQLPVTSSMVCVNYTSSVLASPTCIGSTTTFIITATNLVSITRTTSFAFGVRQMVSPPTLQPSDSFTINSFSGGGYQIDTCTVFASSLQANLFTSVTITPITTMTVNTNVGLKFDLVLSDFCNAFDDIQITFPSQIASTFVNVSGTGVYNTTSSSVSGQTLTVVHRRINAPYSKGSTYTLNFYQIRAPPSTMTSNTITVKIIRNGFDKMVGYQTIRAVASTLTGGTVAATLTTVNRVTSYRINVTTTDALLSSGMVMIVFPSTVIPTLSTGCATLIGTSVTTNPTCTFNSATNTITITSMNSSSSNIPAQTLRFTILSVQNPPSVNPSGTFTVSTYYTNDQNYLVAQGTISGVTATLDVINPSTVYVVPSSYIVSDTLVTYTVNFVNGNAIGQSGYAQITIPSAVTLNIGSLSSYCRLSINSGSYFSTTCSGTSIAGGYYVNFSSIAQSAAIAAGSTISLRISTLLTNPGDTSVVSSFTIKTYHSDYFGIQQLTTGISVQMAIPSTFTQMLVSRSSQLNSDPAVSYTFKLKQTPNLPASSRLIISLPSVLVITNSITCTSLTSVTLTCTRTSNTVTIQLVSSVSSGVQFGVIINNIGNPPSFAPLTTAFSFDTKSSDNMLSYASGTFTPSLQTSTPSSFASLTGTFSSRIYGQATNLQITVTPSSRLAPFYMEVTIPNSFSIPTALSCTYGTCTDRSSNVIRITGITSTSQLTFTVSGMNAPLAATTDFVTINSFDSNGYKIDQNNSNITFSIICTMPCRTCPSGNTTSCQTCYTNTAISTYIYLYTTTATCQQSCPTGTYVDVSVMRCLVCNSLCLTCFGTSTNCTSCVTNSTYPYLFINSSLGTCRTLCPNLYYPDTGASPILCTLCTSPCLACTSANQCTSCTSGFYFYNNSCGTFCPSGTFIANSVTNTCDACSVQCATCATTVNNCIGCSGSAALYNGTCVTVCPAPLVIYNGVCSNCSTTCLTCSITYNNCTSCDTSSSLPYLYNNQCKAVCPQPYYPSLSDGKCILCSTLNIGCDNCTSTSTCGTCNWVQGFVFLANRCYSITPTGYYNNTGYATLCSTSADCATCVNQASNCTSCISLNLEGNICTNSCSAGKVGINKVCVSCTSNCSTCSNIQSNCTSCIPSLTPPVFLTNFQCLASCPSYTYANSSTSECTNCFSPCQQCTSRSQCTSCASGFFKTVTQCINPCPYGYLGINRICQRCTPPCDNCSFSLTLCTACLSGYYLISSTSICNTTCPTGLYPNPSLGTCTGCVSFCDTCSGSATTCTSCLNNLTLFNSSCVSNCPDGYYLLNSQCNPCNVNCTTCSSASVCLTCVFGLYLYNGNCISTCPSSHPVTTTGICTDCSDINCITCNSLDQCSQCNFPSLLLSGHCLTNCPTNYTSNGTNCIYSPINTTNSTNNTSNQTLNQTLTSSNLFPVPFTIGASFIGIACIMSKFQHSYTFIAGSLFSFWSLLQWGALGLGAYLYYQSYGSKFAFTTEFIQVFIFAGGIGFMYLLNVLALFIQNCSLRKQVSFQKWLQKQGPNSCFYIFTSLIGLFFTHKFKNIMFCKLFGFDIFKAQLDSPQSFRIFNALSFLSIIPSGAILFSASYMIYKHHLADQQLMAYIDILILTLACIILAIFNSRKGEDFFEQKDEDGLVINKRIVQSDSIMQAIIPFMAQQHQEKGGNYAKNNTDQTDRKFKSFTQTIFDQPSYHYIQPPKDVHNISIQAAPVLQDYSKINFYNDQQLSQMSMFQKVDKSINMTKQLNANQVSIQYDMNPFEQRQISIQNNPIQQDISVQHQIDVRDVSLQNVANVDDQGIQMSRHEQDHSIQVGVLVNNASIQYSAKPVFQNISQEFIDSQQQQSPNKTSNNQYTITQQRPAQNPLNLKAQLQLDVDQKLRQKQQQLQLQQQLQRQRQKQQMIKKFHKQQQKKQTLNKQKQQQNDKFNNVNRLYNNQNSRLDGSSMMDSNANIMVHFRNNKNKNIREPDNDQQNVKQQRAQSAKTQKQFIQLLESNNNRPALDLQSSMSFNVTRDLQQQNNRNYPHTHTNTQNNNKNKNKNIVYEQQDKIVGSDDDQVDNQQPTNSNKRQIYILQNDTHQQIPSGVEKSRSTNFLSTHGGRRPPLPNRNQSRNLLDQTLGINNSGYDNQEQDIINHPIKPVSRNAPSLVNYKQEDIDYQAKTNLNQLINKRRNNPVSAQMGNRRLPYSQSQQLNSTQKQIRQNPLPLPKIERLKSQQSDNSQRLYKMNTRKVLLEDKKLQFQDGGEIDRFQYNTQQDQPSRLPKVSNSSNASSSRLKNIKSQSKLNERDSFEKPAHRQILGRQRYVDRTQKFLQKQFKKAENTKKKIEQMQVMLERPNINVNRGYLKQTHSSIDKKKRSELQKVYMHNPFEKKN